MNKVYRKVTVIWVHINFNDYTDESLYSLVFLALHIDVGDLFAH